MKHVRSTIMYDLSVLAEFVLRKRVLQDVYGGRSWPGNGKREVRSTEGEDWRARLVEGWTGAVRIECRSAPCMLQ